MNESENFRTTNMEIESVSLNNQHARKTMPMPSKLKQCNSTACVLPDCFCSKTGTSVPGGLNPRDVPMMIVMTFDDWTPKKVFKLFNGRRKNPNGCNIKGTVSILIEQRNLW